MTLKNKTFENSVGRGESEGNQDVLLFPQCFLMAFCSWLLKGGKELISPSIFWRVYILDQMSDQGYTVSKIGAKNQHQAAKLILCIFEAIFHLPNWITFFFFFFFSIHIYGQVV